MDPSHLTQKSTEALHDAQAKALRLGHTEVDGEHLLLAGGAKGKRFSLPNSRLLIHQPSAGFEGQSSDIEIHAREILKVRERIDEIIEQFHVTREQIQAVLEFAARSLDAPPIRAGAPTLTDARSV